MSDGQSPVFLVVAGPAGAGKTAFIETLSDAQPRPGSTERVVSGYRLRYDYGQIAVDETLVVRLLAPPAARQIKLAHQLPAGTLGVVLLVSSADHERLPEARAMIAEYHLHAPVPFVVAATKQDQPGALPTHVLRDRLRIPPGVPLVPCVATDSKSATSVVIRLLHILVDAIEAEDKRRAAALRRHIQQDHPHDDHSF